MDLNDPKNLEKFMASGSKSSYADWAKEQENVNAQNTANAGNIAETQANFNYDTQIKPVTETAGTINQVTAAVIPQQQKLPKLTDIQVSQLNNLGNRTELTGTDITNLKTATNQGYIIPENIKSLLIKQGLSQDFNLTVPNTGKVDLNLSDTNGAVDATMVKADSIKPEDLLGTTTPKTTIMETPATIDSMLSSGQQSLDQLYKQQEEQNAKLKDLQQIESDRLAKGLETAGTTSLESKISEYYNKYDVDSKYNATSNILKQIANARAMYAGTTGTGALTREGIAKISQLQSEYALLNGDFSQAKDMANTYIDAAKSDLTNKINTYQTLLNRSDSKLITLTKDQKDIVNNRIALYEEAVKKQDEKKAELDKVLTENSGYTLTRARQVYGLDTAKDDAQTIQDKVSKAKADQSFIDALASKYYDAGINATDTLQSATDKMKASQSYKQEILRDSKSDSAVVSRAMTLLNNGTAKDIYEALDMANTQISDEESKRKISESAPDSATLLGLDKVVYDRAVKKADQFDNEQIVKDYNTIKTSYNTIKSTSESKTPAGDLSMIFAYMKVLDPTSTVREGEFANAQNAGSAFDKIGNLYNKVLKGTRLNDKQREDFLSQAKLLLDNKKAQYDQVLNQYKESINNIAGQDVADKLLVDYSKISQKKYNIDLTKTDYGEINKFIEDNPQYESAYNQAIQLLDKSGKQFNAEDILKLTLMDDYDNYSFKVEGSDSQNAAANKALSYNTNGLQCGEFINNTVGITVGNTWKDKVANVEKYGNKGSSGVSVGDVIYQDTGTAYGHVAVVTGIDANGNLTVSESNWDSKKNPLKVTHDRVVSPDKIYGYIRPQEATKLARNNYIYA